MSPSLTSFASALFLREPKWKGVEREAVSLYAFCCLVPECHPGRVIVDAAQIGLEVSVARACVLVVKPRVPFARKSERICEDLIVWIFAGMTWQDGAHPLVAIAWKTHEPEVFPVGVEWLERCPSRARDSQGTPSVWT